MDKKEKINKIIGQYAHDFRFMRMTTDDLTEMLTRYTKELFEAIKEPRE